MVLLFAAHTHPGWEGWNQDAVVPDSAGSSATRPPGFDPFSAVARRSRLVPLSEPTQHQKPRWLPTGAFLVP